MAKPPDFIENWFAMRAWRLRAHQLECMSAAAAAQSFLLVAPTGGGKTLAGFLPRSIHTLYISPLKALAVDIARNVQTPISEMGLPIRLETRTGDTPPSRRQRQKTNPPDILLTTPEQIALLLSHEDASSYFSGLKRIILDEIHAFANTKRGHMLALCLSRLRRIAPDLRVCGLSATVPDTDVLLDTIESEITGLCDDGEYVALQRKHKKLKSQL